MSQEISAYHHNFERHFERGRQRIDRLKQVLKHGILSPNEAHKRKVPFKRDLDPNYLRSQVPALENAKHYDDVIFLFRTHSNEVPNHPRIPLVNLVLDEEMKVMTIEEMTEYQSGNWLSFGPFFGYEEVYVLERIEPTHIQQIQLSTHSLRELDYVRKMVHIYLPNSSEILVRGII